VVADDEVIHRQRKKADDDALPPRQAFAASRRWH
jgi:hypothetical protein